MKSPIDGALPFEGINVLDFAWVGVGPIVSRHLADFGANVIRVESHQRPETLRLAPPFRDGIPGIDRSAFGAVFNTNKRGLALNLRLPRARELARRLVPWADIVTESMTPGSMAKLGLGYDDLRAINPSIVMYSTTQQGQTGPYRSFGGYGQHGAATAGLHGMTGWPDLAAAGVYGAYTDFIAPWFLYTALVAALDHRDRTGEGQHLDQSQVEAGLQMLGPFLMEYFATGQTLHRNGNADLQFAPHGVYPCQGSDRWVAVAVRDNHEWAALCTLIGKSGWASDPSLQTPDGRQAQGAEIDQAIANWTSDRDRYQAMEELAGAGIPAGVVQTPEDLFTDPQLEHRGHWWRMNHAVIGEHAYDAPVWKLSETPAQPRRAGPALGQHTHEVLTEILGLSDAEIADLVAEGVLD